MYTPFHKHSDATESITCPKFGEQKKKALFSQCQFQLLSLRQYNLYTYKIHTKQISLLKPLPATVYKNDYLTQSRKK